MIKNICIYGVGGVGGYFGAKMIEADAKKEFNISFIARGNHLSEIQDKGLTLKTENKTIVVKPKLATNDINDIDDIDMVLLCVKSYDLAHAIEDLKEVIEENTVIIPLLNGVDIYERIRNITEKGIVMPACVYVGTHIEKPGVIFQKGGTGKIIFGRDPQNKFDQNSVRTVFDKLQINYIYKENPYKEIWTKYIFISAYGLVTASTEQTIGMVYENEKLRNDVLQIMNEIMSIANKKNISLDNNVIEESLNKASIFPYETKTSFQRDIENPNKNNEKEIFGQTIIDMGKELNVDTKMTELYYKMLV